jgi:hypothetical protein
VEVGSKTSIVILRVVGGDEKENLKSESVKYGLEHHGHRPEKGCAGSGPAAYTKDRLVVSSERATQKRKTVIVSQSQSDLDFDTDENMTEHGRRGTTKYERTYKKKKRFDRTRKNAKGVGSDLTCKRKRSRATQREVRYPERAT